MFALNLIDHSGYDIVADLRSNLTGRQSLFYNNHKFTKNTKTQNNQHWKCTKHSSEKCRASVSTMENINGITMMRILNAEHTHAEPCPETNR